jgi:hypothetical protein
VGYARLEALITAALAGVGLAFVVPTAIGRAVLLAPIAIEMARRLGFEKGSRGSTGLILTAGMSTSLPAFAILPSNVPNVVMTGIAENLYEKTFSYGEYLAINFPVLGGFGVICIVLLNWVLFRDEPKAEIVTTSETNFSRVEFALSLVLCATILLWITDAWHGVGPSWIAMGAALLCTSPLVGALSARDLTTKINFGPMFFVAGVIGFGAVVSDLGLSQQVGSALVGNLHSLGDAGDGLIYAAIMMIGMIVAAGTTVPTAPGLMTPLAGELSAITGWSIDSVLLMQVPTWVIIPLPYLVPPLVLTITVGKVPPAQAVKLFLCYFIVGLTVLAPAHFAWARWIGALY